MIKFYTDGGCSGNPGPGSFGVAALNEEETILLYNVYIFCQIHFFKRGGIL